MKKVLVSALAVTLCAVPLFVSAESGQLMSYNYADLTYNHTWFDADGVDDSDGGSVAFSHSPFEHFFFNAGYHYANTGFSGHNVNLHEFSYGGGGYYAFNDRMHFVAGFNGLFADLDEGGDDNGLRYGGTIRALATDDLELNFGANYTDYEDFGEGWGYHFRALVPVGCNFTAIAGASMDDDDNVGFEAGMRMNF